MDTKSGAKFPGGSFIRISIILLYREIPQRLQQIGNLAAQTAFNLYTGRSECRQIHNAFSASP